MEQQIQNKSFKENIYFDQTFNSYEHNFDLKIMQCFLVKVHGILISNSMYILISIKNELICLHAQIFQDKTPENWITDEYRVPKWGLYDLLLGHNLQKKIVFLFQQFKETLSIFNC